MPAKLSRTATIESVWSTLTHQRKYVATVRHRMELCHRQNGNCHVRIGVTGTGQKPCYRIFFIEAGKEQIVGSYWDMHDPLEIEDASTANWSDASMSFEEVDTFFKREIGWTK